MAKEKKNWDEKLEEHGLGRYVPLFRAKGLTESEDLAQITDIDLQDLGIASEEDRKTILRLFVRRPHPALFRFLFFFLIFLALVLAFLL